MNTPGMISLGVMEFRRLTPPEIEGVAQEFTSRGVGIPDPRTSFIMGAWEGEELQGFMVAQGQIHLEPIRSWNPHCAGPLIQATGDEVLKTLGPVPVFCICSGRTARLAQTQGFLPHPESLFFKDLK